MTSYLCIVWLRPLFKVNVTVFLVIDMTLTGDENFYTLFPFLVDICLEEEMIT